MSITYVFPRSVFLDWGVPLEATNTTSGTALARAIEFSHLALVRLLIARDADRVSPCTPGGNCTPLDLAKRAGDAEILALVQEGPPSPSPAPSDDPPTTSKRQKLSKDGGDGMPQASLVSFSKSVRKLWEEYTGTHASETSPILIGTAKARRTELTGISTIASASSIER